MEQSCEGTALDDDLIGFGDEIDQLYKEFTYYPKDPTYVRMRFQHIANRLASDIQHDTGKKQSFRVDTIPEQGQYAYQLTSDGVSTVFRLVPTLPSGSSQSAKLSLYTQDMTYFSTEMMSLSQSDAIEKILGLAYSANKDFSCCKEYQFLKKLPELVHKKEFKNRYHEYKKTYDRIMATHKFYDLSFSKHDASSTRWPKFGWGMEQRLYMNARWKIIQEEVKKQDYFNRPLA